MNAQATRDARTHARSCDPIERIRRDITYSALPHMEVAFGRHETPAKSDLEVGIDWLIAAAKWRIHKIIDARADLHLHELSVLASSRHAAGARI